MFLTTLFQIFSRKKRKEDEEEEEEELTSGKVKVNRVLGLLDLVMLGVSATMGVGVYILAGSVARNQAGPAVIISFFIAAVASLFSALCYSEFASRFSKSGSAYIYTYVSLGEFAAFIIGWNLLLENVIGTASEAKAISSSIDLLCGNVYKRTVEPLIPFRTSFMAPYPDFIAAFFVLIITCLVSYGVKASAEVNNVFTFYNLLTVGIVLVSGSFKINPQNWSVKKEQIPKNVRGGNGGFMPFGITGVIEGAAKCFFGFVGFDGISTTGEVSKNPKRDIPLAIILSVIIVFCCYFSVGVVLTLILPYYDQNPDAPFTHAFTVLGWPFMKWTVTIGSLCALFTAMIGILFPLARVLCLMSRDGLLYKRFSNISPYTETPLFSTIVGGLFTATMATVFKLEQLVDMMSIGTLLAYIIVAMSVLLLRYCDCEDSNSIKKVDGNMIYGDANQIREIKRVLDALDESVQNNEIENHDFRERKTRTEKNKAVNHCFQETDRHKVVSIRNQEMNIDCTRSSKTPINKIEKHQDSYEVNHNLFVKVFNLKNTRKVSTSSQNISKLCIYLLIILNVMVCLILNHLTYDEEIERMRAEAIFHYENRTDLSDFSQFPSEVLEDFRKYQMEHNNKLHFVISRAIGVLSYDLEFRDDSDLLTHGLGKKNDYFKSRSNSSFQENILDLKESIEKRDRLSTPKIVMFATVGIIYVMFTLILTRQPSIADERVKFKVPLVPLIPLMSIFLNLYLMLNLDINTITRFLTWMTVGGFIYFTYSIHHSKLKPPSKSKSSTDSNETSHDDFQA